MSLGRGVLPCLLIALTAQVAPAFEVSRSPSPDGWRRMFVPGTWERGDPDTLKDYDGLAWYRFFVRVPADWADNDLALSLGRIDQCDEVFFNGALVGASGSMPPHFKAAPKSKRDYQVPAKRVRFGEWNLVAVRVYDGGGEGGFGEGYQALHCSKGVIPLEGYWQFRTGDNTAWRRWPARPNAKKGQNAVKEFVMGMHPGSEGVFFDSEAQAPQGRLTLWSRRPADTWNEAFPVGNGRLGAMVFGGVRQNVCSSMKRPSGTDTSGIRRIQRHWRFCRKSAG